MPYDYLGSHFIKTFGHYRVYIINLVSFPITLLIESVLTAPDLRILGIGPVKSTIVEGEFKFNWPPSMIRSTSFPNCSLTSDAPVHGGLPDILALVPVRGAFRALTNCLGIG